MSAGSRRPPCTSTKSSTGASSRWRAPAAALRPCCSARRSPNTPFAMRPQSFPEVWARFEAGGKISGPARTSCFVAWAAGDRRRHRSSARASRCGRGAPPRLACALRDVAASLDSSLGDPPRGGLPPRDSAWTSRRRRCSWRTWRTDGSSWNGVATRTSPTANRICAKYRSLRLGLVDAVVIAVAERLEAEAIATLDLRHFGAVTIRGAPKLLPRDDGSRAARARRRS